MEKRRNTRLISIIVVAYMLIALIWWTVLLFKKNEESFSSKQELHNHQLIDNQSMEVISDKYQRQKYMIIGEGVVFGIMLIIGIHQIVKSYSRELALAKKENNFLLSITHELKSPIASIQLILDTFKKRQLKEEIFQDLTNSGLEETERLNSLVGNLLYANKLNYGHDYNFEKINLSELTHSCLKHFAKTHQEFMISDQIENDIYASVDQDAFKIVLNNLFENAGKYSDQSKVVEVHLIQNDQIQLMIKDQGIGIEKGEKNNIFSKFYRIGNEDTRETKGTGLGLFICAEIIKGHKGQIKVLDNKPKGSIFEITLPKYVG